MLAKFVFVSLGYKGWTKLSPHELHEKAEPYKFAVREQWKRLGVEVKPSTRKHKKLDVLK